MSTTRAHRRHTVRIAAITTLLVMLSYLIAAIVVNLIVTNRLVANVDARLLDRIEDTRQQASITPTIAPGNDRDIDDAPSFLWSISPRGAVTVLTPGAPPLPTRPWNSEPTSVQVGRSTFRFDARHVDGTTIVAGQSVANTSNVQSTLLLAEIVFGAILAVAVFCGALLVGLRAAAPSELVRRRQAEFTADASHELRTPISVIEAEVELALDHPRDPKVYREVLYRVGREGARLRHIVEDLLWLARADDDHGHDGLDESTDVAEVAEACTERFTAVAETQGVSLHAGHVGPGPFIVQASRELVDRLAGVLIDNACKFAGQGGRVEVSVRISGSRIVLRVDDSGPGIPEDQRDAVFDRFHRATDSVLGTGLGLAIADSVVRSTEGSWDIGVAELGGARMEANWRRAGPRRSRVGPTEVAPLSESLA
ncbi:MAG TPA: HAMP domain-containing sensor histidine kinase [Acidimicrobiales bacterium]|jgi:signal transduction histidine kinase|nr:HAMP domain-containing sensor histidine kinase [Acidimicrobiales bacterium]